MRENENITENTRRTSGRSSRIEERMLDEGERSPGSMDAASAS
jgi:hypothetical protein